MKTYEESIAAGSELLNAGDTTGALQVFQKAAEQLGASNATSEVLQLIGVCWRMLGSYNVAAKMFGRAYKIADNDSDRGRIKRDWAMVPLAQDRFDEAYACLDESLALLANHDVIEYAATMGFVGRVFARSGEREAAYMQHHMTDLLLRSHSAPPIYELNNLVHWMEVAGLRQRIRLGRRAWPIARQHANRRRLEQIVLLIVCRPLAVRLTHV